MKVHKPPVIFHPFLFAIFPALSIVSDHIRFLTFNITILGLSIVTILVTLAGLLLLRLARVDRQKAGIIVSLALLLFFSYGHLYYFLSRTFSGFDLRHRHLLLLWIVLAVILGFLSKKADKHLATYTNFLNIMGISLVTLSCVQIAGFEIATRNVWQSGREFESAEAGVENFHDTPDVYYLIFDTYASTSTLRDAYEHDNGEFIAYLHERGFYVADESFSNYSVTALSLASSLNMDYIDRLSPDYGANGTNWEYELPKQMIENNNVMWYLKSKGYQFIFLGSGRGVTQGNRYADREIKCGYVDETVGRIIESTLIWPAADQLQVMANDDRNQRLCVFATLADMPNIEGPKFVFAHILAPHQPFLFDADGDPVREAPSDLEHTKRAYVNQLVFINQKIQEMVDAILSSSEVEPIIVLQGDTGPPYGFEPGAALENPTEDIYRQNMRILNAYYLPKNGPRSLYPGISPVNTFRMIFNLYFAADIPLLKDKSYFLLVDQDVRRFLDVTESVDFR